MKQKTFLAVRLATATMAVLSLSSSPSISGAEAGFKELFNGKDLTGWTGDPQLWSVKDGVITGQTTKEHPAKGNTFLIWTNGTVGDFELACTFKITPGPEKFANSGIQYRSKVLDPEHWVVGGYQADMEAGTNYTGILYEERMTRGIMAARGEKVVWTDDCKKTVTGSLGLGSELQQALHEGDWNEYVIIARGNHLQHFINGKQTVDVTDECEAKRAASGVLALQLHAGSPMMVQFRSVRLKTFDAATPAAADDQAQIQGQWQVTAAASEGNPVPSEDLAEVIVTFQNDTYKVSGTDSPDRGKFILDPAKSPKQFTIKPGTGANAGDTMPGIYEISGDTLRICYNTQGGKAPKSLASEDSGEFSVVCKRKQPQR